MPPSQLPFKLINLLIQLAMLTKINHANKISKINFIAGKTDSPASASSDEIDALLALGYSIIQARQALSAVDPKIKESGERIRQALRKLGK